MDIYDKLNSGLYNLAHIAKILWPDLPGKSSQSKLLNKIKRLPGRKLSDDEIKKIEIILK